MAYDFTKRFPEVHADTYIADGAQVIGKVVLEKGVSIWHNCVLRGDINDVIIKENSNIQDNTVIHVSDDYPAIVGIGCTVGHNAIIHACTIGDYCLIGMGAIVMDGAVIGNQCIIAAGALVSPGKKFPDNTLIVGSPAVAKRQLTKEEIEHNHYIAKKYIEVWKAYVTHGIPCYDGKREIRLPLP